MAQVIATNTLSQLTQNNLDKSQKAQNQAIERLSSGQRINSAKDDAAGLAISDRMTSQVNGLKQANRNANDGMSMAQTAESALSAVTDNLQRVRELVVQAKNGTYTDEDRQSINNEIDARLQEVDRIGKDTTFNGKQLLGSSDKTYSGTAQTDAQLTTKLQIGAFDGQTIDLKMTDVRSAASTLKGGSDQTISGNALISSAGVVSDSALTTIDAQIKSIDSTRSTLGAQQNRLESTVESNAATATNLSAAKSQISDADYASEVSAMSTAQILQQAGQNVLSQANSVPQNVLSLLKS
ncbi:flagellin N-terminal helical domain-containing protein [Zymobacter palmae]|uniref:Flagellin n=1 Tax=Zymobacter palmae TaxID=33074 RepID=A0A348HBL4_9GAMM|nr:flagellin [Zymobacter palmae]BBG29016.1 flagellin and related hook-associated proteins [Zymobacter palmae]